MINACVDVKVTMLRTMQDSVKTFNTSLGALINAFDDVEYVLRGGSYERDNPECGAEWRALFNKLKEELATKSYGNMGIMSGILGFVCSAIVEIDCSDPNYADKVATALVKLVDFQGFVLTYKTYVDLLVAQRNSLCTVSVE